MKTSAQLLLGANGTRDAVFPYKISPGEILHVEAGLEWRKVVRDAAWTGTMFTSSSMTQSLQATFPVSFAGMHPTCREASNFASESA